MATEGSETKNGNGVDVLDLLQADHRQVEELVDDFEAAEDESEQLELAQQICTALTVHAEVEEEIFYPAVREALGEEAEDLLAEAEVEHGSAKDLIAQVEASEPDDPLFKAQVKVLGEYVKHHVREEENELFPRVRESGLDREELGRRAQSLRQELLADQADAGETDGDDLETDDEAPDEDEEVSVTPPKGSRSAEGRRPAAR